MSTAWSLKSTLIATLAFSMLACGQKNKEPQPDPNKKDPVAQPTPNNPQTPTQEPAPNKEQAAALIAALPAGDVLSQIPPSAFLVGGLGKIDKYLTLAKSIGEKAGVKIEENPEFKEASAEFKAQTGLDLMDPELINKLGIDGAKGIAFALDGSVTFKKVTEIPGTATLLVEQVPMVYGVAVASTPGTFEKFLKDTLEKNKGKYLSRFEDVALTEPDKITYVYQTPTVQDADVKEALEFALVQKGGYLYIFGAGLSKFENPAAGDPIADFKTTLKSYLDKKSGTITGEAAFTAAARKIDTQGNFFLYTDLTKLASAMEATGETPIYDTPKNENEKIAQEMEKASQEVKRTEQVSDLANFKMVSAAVPQLAFSLTLVEGKFSLKGTAIGSPMSQAIIEKIFVPSSATPAYATVFPENTTAFWRSSLSPAGIKDAIFAFLPADKKTNAEAEFNEAKGEFQRNVGLDLENDILKGITGHFSIGAESIEAIAVPAAAYMMEGNPPQALPKLMLSMQVASAEVGDKLLKTLQDQVTAMSMGAVVITEEPGVADKFYTASVIGLYNIAWGRSGDLILLGTDTTLVKESLGRVKTPGASFADKLPALGKSLVTDKSTNGLTMNVGTLLGAISELPSVTNPEDKEMMKKLSAILGTFTTDLSYGEGLLTYELELTWK